MIVKKQFFKTLFFLFLSVGISAQTFITWQTGQGTSQDVGVTSITGTANLGGTTGTVTATVTASLNTSTGWNFQSSTTTDYDVIFSSDKYSLYGITNGDTNSAASLGTSNNNQWFYSYKKRVGPNSPPNIFKIKFDKPVVISELGIADMNASGTGNNESLSLSGYTFASQTNNLTTNFSPIPTVSTSGIDFQNGTTNTLSTGQAWVKYVGTATLPANTELVITFLGKVPASQPSTSSTSSNNNIFNTWAIKVCPATVITTQPTSPSAVCINGNAGLSVAANEAVSYQWYSNSSNSNTGGTAISGATSTTYSPSTTTAGTYYYYVVATGVCNSVASNAVTVQVNNCTAAVADALGTVTAGSNTLSVFINDKSSNGTTPTSANTDVSLTSLGGLTGATMNADGTIAIPANATPGSYTLTYRICSPKGQTTNCSTATVTLTVPNQTSAVNDALGIITPGSNTLSVFVNDKSSNGTTPTSANTDVSLTNLGGLTGATMNADGTIAIPVNATPGSYTLTYRICSPKGQTTNCSTATVTLYVDKDSDGDGIFDLQDLDDDNDGILDCEERGIKSTDTVSEIFKINGDAAKVATNQVRLTQDATDLSGSMWSNGKVDFSNSFSMKVLANLGTKTGTGADGVAIVFHNDPAGVNAIGGRNAGLGAGYGPYTVGGPFQEGIKKGIALELDTYQNDQATFGDIANDHGQIWLTANQRTGQLTTPVDLGELEDGQWKTVIINWNATTKTISYTVNGTVAGTYTGDLVANVFGSNMVYVGFTASTGGFSNAQHIKFDSFCTDLPVDLDTDNDGIVNRLDLDSDGDGCSDAVEGDENVISTQLNANGSINYAANGGLGSVSGTDLGVPNLVNSGGTADVGSDAGQGVGNAYNSFVLSCIDAVNDNFTTTPINATTGGTTASVFANDVQGRSSGGFCFHKQCKPYLASLTSCRTYR